MIISTDMSVNEFLTAQGLTLQLPPGFVGQITINGSAPDRPNVVGIRVDPDAGIIEFAALERGQTTALQARSGPCPCGGTWGVCEFHRA